MCATWTHLWSITNSRVKSYYSASMKHCSSSDSVISIKKIAGLTMRTHEPQDSGSALEGTTLFLGGKKAGHLLILLLDLYDQNNSGRVSPVSSTLWKV